MNLAALPGYVRGMHDWRLWRYEARRAGRHLLIAPPLLAGVLLATGLGLRGAGFTGAWLAQSAPPLVAGLAVAAVVGGERAAELHLSLPTPLRTTLGRRLALLGAATVLGALILAAGLLPDAHALSRFAALCAFGAMLGAAGAWSAAALRSTAGASTVVLAAWLAELFVLDRIFAAPAVRIVAQLVLAALFAAPASRLLAEGRGLIEGGRE